MQRKHIKVGDVLYWQRLGDWNRDTLYGHGRVTVVAVEPHRSVYGGGFEPGRSRTSADLLVDLETYADHTGTYRPVRRALVAPADLRGPHEETLAAAKEREAEKIARNRAARAERDAQAAEADTAVNRVRVAGYSSAFRTGRDNRIDISATDLIALLDALDRAKREAYEAGQALVGEREAEGE